MCVVCEREEGGEGGEGGGKSIYECFVRSKQGDCEISWGRSSESTDLHQEEGDTICAQGATELNVTKLGVQFTEIV